MRGGLGFVLAITIQVPFLFLSLLYLLPFLFFLDSPLPLMTDLLGELTYWSTVYILTYIRTCVNYDNSGILSCPCLAGFIWSTDYKSSTLERLYTVFSVQFCSCLDYPCILYFQVSLYSNRWSNITPSSQILSLKLLVSLDLQNFSFYTKNSLATLFSLLVVWLAWVAQFACPWLDNGSSIPFRQPSWNYNASYFLNLSLDCDRQFAVLTYQHLSGFGILLVAPA